MNEWYLIGGLVLVGFIIYLYLKSPETRRRNFNKSEKEAILKRQDYQCATCDDEDWKLFEFHHKKPFAEGGETSVKNGVALCAKCHSAITRNYNGN